MEEEYKIPPEVEEITKKISGGWWNYRVVETRSKWTDMFGQEREKVLYEVYEVYYYGNGEIWGWTEKPVRVCFEDYADMEASIKHIKDACKKTTLLLVKDGEDEKLIDTHTYVKGLKKIGKRRS